MPFTNLRRFVQTNNAVNSPRASMGKAPGDVPSSPLVPNGHSTPGTRRTRISYPITPETSPSLSASVPFDWDAARQRKPPPYASPLQSRTRTNGLGDSTNGKTRPKRVVKKKSLYERATSLPSDIMFEIMLFPHNVPLPSLDMGAWIVGGVMHLVHLSIRVSQLSKVSDDDLPWMDMYNEHNGVSWFNWAALLTILLIGGAFVNALTLFTHIKIYNLHHRSELVNSPRAAFVTAKLDFDSLEVPPLRQRIMSWIGQRLRFIWTFFWNLKSQKSDAGPRMERVQQLSMWDPGMFETTLLTIYSPAHAFLWTATNGSNWIMMFAIMAMVGLQTYLLIQNYAGLIKDKAIISAEVMHEYDKKFVNPRVNPIRKDAAVMTHQSEVVNIWED